MQHSKEGIEQAKGCSHSNSTNCFYSYLQVRSYIECPVEDGSERTMQSARKEGAYWLLGVTLGRTCGCVECASERRHSYRKCTAQCLARSTGDACPRRGSRTGILAPRGISAPPGPARSCPDRDETRHPGATTQQHQHTLPPLSAAMLG